MLNGGDQGWIEIDFSRIEIEIENENGFLKNRNQNRIEIPKIIEKSKSKIFSARIITDRGLFFKRLLNAPEKWAKISWSSVADGESHQWTSIDVHVPVNVNARSQCQENDVYFLSLCFWPGFSAAGVSGHWESKYKVCCVYVHFLMVGLCMRLNPGTCGCRISGSNVLTNAQAVVHIN